MKDRELIMDDARRQLHYERRTTLDWFRWEEEAKPDRLASEAKELTLNVFGDLLAYFDFRPKQDLLAEMYDQNMTLR